MPKQANQLVPMLVTCIFAGTILAILAPLGTEIFSNSVRFVFWVGLCVVGGLGAALTHGFEKIFGIKLGNWQCALAQSITSSLAVATALLILNLVTYGAPTLKQGLTVFFYVWVISATISVVGMLLRKSKAPAPSSPARPAIYERLAPKLRTTDIYALAAEDHYVRVITSNGDELVLMRLSDAIKDMAPLPGLSPHRSWWVAESGVEKVTKSEIILKSGQSVPISRTGKKAVREAGWT